MTGQRRAGSSIGSGTFSTVEADPVIRSTSWANSATVNSSGLPRFTGPRSVQSIMLTMPRIRSST
jgi:hypothetical protein